jgi:arsenite methyltransferase
VTESSESVPVGEEMRERVRDRYGKIASGGGCCSSEGGSCCGGSSESSEGCCHGSDQLNQLGYTADDIRNLPEGANLGLGCGNPTGLLSLETGQVVLDLGSGAGIDCFLAAKKVGPEGRVIGVDMTPEMIAKARSNARSAGFPNVEFRLGEIEHLPAADRSVDVVISNCVINLAPDKSVVYREAFRVLRPGGHFAVSDVVATRPISPEERQDPSAWSSCSSGAIEVREIEDLLRSAGFSEVEVRLKVPAETLSSLEKQASLGVVPADIRATRPRE